MKEVIKNNKKFIIIAIVIVILLLIGVTFAYLTTTLRGHKEYVIRAESLNLTLSEGNELTLEKVIPLEDEEGMKLDGFSFSLTNNGNKEADYYIYLDDLDIGNEENRIEDYSLRYSLTRNDEVFMTRNLSTMGSNPNRRVDFGIISPDETINYTLRIWIDYEATSEEAGGKTFKGKLRVVSTQPVGEEVSTVLLENIPEDNQYNDVIDTFITGEDPNNYIWYSGKLWRAVSVNNEEKTVKLVTQWNISSISYSSGSSTFEGSYMEEWLNDTSVDGFLGNLRDYENFIVTDATWDTTMDNRDLGSITKPDGTTIVSQDVGLLNMYEYQSSYHGTTTSNAYLNNGLGWWTLTPYNDTDIYSVSGDGDGLASIFVSTGIHGIRPSINLRNDVKIVSGSGTENDPYRLLGDADEELSGVKLNTRYSGEYIRFGTGENNLYRIVSHEIRELTKIASVEPLKDNGQFKTIQFGSTVNYSNSNTIGTFLNGEYLTSYVGENYSSMIEDNTTWYIVSVRTGTSYRLAKYINETDNVLTSDTVIAKVGLFRYGELMAGQFARHGIREGTTNGNLNSSYWIITPYDQYVRYILTGGGVSFGIPSSGLYGIKPTMNLKANVIITSGDGTKENPFELSIQ